MKHGHLFLNRFAVDEDPCFEIVKVLELEKASWAMTWPDNPEYENFENDRKQKAIDLMGTKELPYFVFSPFKIKYRLESSYIRFSLKVLVYNSYGMIHTE